MERGFQDFVPGKRWWAWRCEGGWVGCIRSVFALWVMVEPLICFAMVMCVILGGVSVPAYKDAGELVLYDLDGGGGLRWGLGFSCLAG